MKRLISSTLLAFVCSIASIAQDAGTGFIGNGYYRIHNLGTNRYIYVTDNKDYYDMARDREDFQAIQLWKDASKTIPEPATVIYIEQVSTNAYDLTAQATGVHSLTGYYVNVTKLTDGSYEVSATKSGVTKYLSDDRTNDKDQGKMGTSGKLIYRRWIVDKIETNHATNYVGIKPTIELNGKYYQPFYASFPFRPVSADMHVYIVNQIDGNYGILQEIEGEVPGATPVIIECTSADPSQNRLELLATTAAKVSGNMLSGVYFCNGDRPEESKDAYKKFDAETMRVLTTSNGKLVLSNNATDRLKEIEVVDYEEYVAVNALCLPANTSYLPADASMAAEIMLTSDPTGIASVAKQDSPQAEGIYSTSGTMLRRTNNTAGLPAGIYIVGGKKVAVK